MRVTKLPIRIRNSIASRIETRRWNAYQNRKHRKLKGFSGTPTGPIFIFGCQRSGTTHVERLFRADPRSSVFGEFSTLSISPKHTVWQDHSAMQKILAQNPGAYWVVRSLFSSHQILETLQAWPGGTAIWIFRDANSVVDSMIRKWQGSFRAISERVESNQLGHWALRRLWNEVEAEAKALAPSARREEHWRNVYALFWAARNSLVFELNLAKSPRVLLSDYDDFTRDPEKCLSVLWERVGTSAPKNRYMLETRGSLGGKQHKARFSPAVQKKCDSIYERLRVAAKADPISMGTA